MSAEAISVYFASMEWLGIAFDIFVTVLIILIVGTILRRFEGILGYIGYQLQKGAALVTGMALVALSGAINSTFAMQIIKAFPQYAAYEDIAAIALAAVNLSAIWAAVAITRAKMREAKRPEMFRLYSAWALIISFSMVTASTMLNLGNDRIEKMNTIAVDYEKYNNEKIKSNEADIKAPPNISASAAKLGMVITTNSNGAKVRVSSVCKRGGWYDTNRPSCSRYLAALDASGQAARNSELRKENVSLMKDSLDKREAAPVPFRASIGPVEIPYSWMVVLIALVIEIAAGLSLGQAMNMGALSSTVNADPTDSSKSAKKDPPAKNKTGSGSGRTDGTNGNKGGSSSGSGSDGSKNLKNQSSKSELKGVDSAFDSSFTGDPKGAEIDESIRDFIYQLALSNPHERAVANDINSAIKDRRGKGVKKQRILDALSHPDLSHAILIKTTGVSREFTYRKITENEPEKRSPVSDERSYVDGEGRSQTAYSGENAERPRDSA